MRIGSDNMFFITCFEKIEINDYGFPNTGYDRTFGYVETFEIAESCLNKNMYDMHECLYDYAVVEEIGSGIHPDVRHRWFFKWDNSKEGFYIIKEPEEFKHYCNIALG